MEIEGINAFNIQTLQQQTPSPVRPVQQPQRPAAGPSTSLDLVSPPSSPLRSSGGGVGGGYKPGPTPSRTTSTTSITPSGPVEMVIVGVRCAVTNAVTKFRLFKTQALDSVMKVYEEKSAPLLQRYYLEHAIPKSEQKVIYKFDGVPITSKQTPGNLGMIDNDTIQATLPVPITSAHTTVDSLTKKIVGSEALLKDFGVLDDSPQQQRQQASSSSSASQADDPDAEYVIIKVRRVDDPSEASDMFRIKTTDKFEKLLTGYCNKKRLDPKKVQLLFDGLPLKLTTTPEHHDMEDEDLIEAKIAPGAQLSASASTTTTTTTSGGGGGFAGGAAAQDNAEYVIIRVRRADNPTDIEQFRIKTTDKFEKLLTAYCKKKNVSTNRITLLFDGLPVKPHTTPESHDMEDDDLIDAKFI